MEQLSPENGLTALAWSPSEISIFVRYVRGRAFMADLRPDSPISATELLLYMAELVT